MMGALERIIQDLRGVEEALGDQPVLARRVHAIATALSGDELRWIDHLEAERILEVTHPKAIETWVRLGLLRGRHEDDGTLMVQLADVLREKAAADLLDNGDDRELNDDELALLGKPQPAPLR